MLELDRKYTLTELQLLIDTRPTYLPREMVRKYYELGIVAQALPVIFGDQNTLITIPDDSYEKAPDAQIETGRWPRRKKTGMEVVTYTRFSEKEGLTKFFGRTKLADTVAYPKGTIIVCDIQLPLRNPDRTAQNISWALSQWSRNIPYLVYLYSGQYDSPYLAKLH